MVHIRLNDPDTVRSPHINFVRALKHLPGSDEAQRRLEQIAALFRPVMKDYGFTVNSLEEFEHNREFSGRNWNAGETVELVLRTAQGGWRSMQSVIYVMCHELAHITHMNHLPLHGRLTIDIRAKVTQLIGKGYFGDGFWSAGYRLVDGLSGTWENDVRMELNGAADKLCGGAQRGKRQSFKRRGGSSGGTGGPSRSRQGNGPSMRTGAQTSQNTPTAGSKRIRRALPGEGTVLSRDSAGAEGAVSFRRKQTHSKAGRAQRLAAIEDRLRQRSPVPAALTDHSDGTNPNIVDAVETEEQPEPGLRGAASGKSRAPAHQEIIDLCTSDDDG